jgi:hypothetical protein
MKEAVKEVVKDEHFGTGLMEEAQAGTDHITLNVRQTKNFGGFRL